MHVDDDNPVPVVGVAIVVSSPSCSAAVASGSGSSIIYLSEEHSLKWHTFVLCKMKERRRFESWRLLDHFRTGITKNCLD